MRRQQTRVPLRQPGGLDTGVQGKQVSLLGNFRYEPDDFSDPVEDDSSAFRSDIVLSNSRMVSVVVRDDCRTCSLISCAELVISSVAAATEATFSDACFAAAETVPACSQVEETPASNFCADCSSSAAVVATDPTTLSI